MQITIYIPTLIVLTCNLRRNVIHFICTRFKLLLANLNSAMLLDYMELQLKLQIIRNDFPFAMIAWKKKFVEMQFSPGLIKVKKTHLNPPLS